MAVPSDEELAVMFRWTMHTRWGVGGLNGYGAKGDDFVCMCSFCRELRRKRFEKEQT